MVTRGQERCLYVWPTAEFARLTERLRDLPVANKAGRDYVRMLFSAASDEKPDKQGRITIPAQLRSYASLEREIVISGAMNRVEIWDAEAWNAYEADREPAFSDLENDDFIPPM